MRKGNEWMLGIIKSIFPIDAVPYARIFVWARTFEIQEKPTFATGLGCKKWSDIIHHFNLNKFETDDIELKFVNKVSSIPIGNKPVCSSVRNVIDGGLQSSIFEPDVFDHEIPRPSGKTGLILILLSIPI